MKESSKKKLVRSTWAGLPGHKKIGDEKLAESRCSERGGDMVARKTKIGLH